MSTQWKAATVAAALVGAVGLSAMQAQAASFTLNFGGNSVAFEDSNATIEDWNVGGTDHLSQTSYMYRVGSAGGESLFGAGQTVASVQTTTFLSDSLLTTYTDASNGFIYQMRLTLTGSGDNSHLSVSQTVTNTSNGVLDFHLFEYNDLDLGGSFANDSVVSSVNGATQTDALAQVQFVQTQSGGNPIAGSDQDASAAFASILTALSDANPTNLTADFGTHSFGPGDATFASQWDLTLAATGPGSVFQNTIEKNLEINAPVVTSAIPEPVSAVLGGLGLLTLAGALSRRRRA